MPKQKLRYSLLVLIVGTCGAAFGYFSSSSAKALEVAVSPQKPNLGDTLSVLITPDPGETLQTAPSVSVDGKTLPAFEIAPNRWRAFIPTTPLEKHGRRTLTVTGNEQQRNLLLWVGDKWYPTQSIWLPPDKDSDEGTDYEFDKMDALKALVTPQKFWSGPFTRPNSGPLSTGFGVRRYYNGVFADDYYHRGLDYAGYAGSPVVATAAGRVALVGREADGFEIHGNCVGIDHGQGIISIYIHLSSIGVKEGQMVSAGQEIGKVGSTGASTGPHLHFGLYVNGQSIQPAQWLSSSME